MIPAPNDPATVRPAIFAIMSNRPLHVSGPGMTTSEAMQMAECTGCGSHGSKTKTKILRKHRTYCFLDYSTDDQNHVKIMRLCHRARQLANWRQRTREVDYQALNDTEASNMLNEFMATVQNRTDEWHTQVGLVVAGIDERQAGKFGHFNDPLVDGH